MPLRRPQKYSAETLSRGAIWAVGGDPREGRLPGAPPTLRALATSPSGRSFESRAPGFGASAPRPHGGDRCRDRPRLRAPLNGGAYGSEAWRARPRAWALHGPSARVWGHSPRWSRWGSTERSGAWRHPSGSAVAPPEPPLGRLTLFAGTGFKGMGYAPPKRSSNTSLSGRPKAASC